MSIDQASSKVLPSNSYRYFAACSRSSAIITSAAPHRFVPLISVPPTPSLSDEKSIFPRCVIKYDKHARFSIEWRCCCCVLVPIFLKMSMNGFLHAFCLQLLCLQFFMSITIPSNFFSSFFPLYLEVPPLWTSSLLLFYHRIGAKRY